MEFLPEIALERGRPCARLPEAAPLAVYELDVAGRGGGKGSPQNQSVYAAGDNPTIFHQKRLQGGKQLDKMIHKLGQ